jgi:glycosyltransferase involved in cell wall biosynthesis
MNKKLLFIAPHLSTGGMPQYLYKQMESLINDFDIWCIEWDNVTGGVLVVQRNRILELIGDKLITLVEDKTELLSYIAKIKPDIVHLQEIPEMFMDYGVAEKLYDDPDRKYVIVETSHDSSFDVKNKKHYPDKFMMVSNYQIESYKSLDIPCELVEYPIEYKKRSKSKDLLLKELGLDPDKKHVIIVGLFTPRKNQAEAIQYAKMLQNYPIQFHFIGNQADNFKYYWEPLMKDFPDNCKWWGERSDVDTFYQIADLFLFTSKGNSSDKETMPLVIREAISWEVPSLIYNLPVYMDYFSTYNNIKYLDFIDVENNKNIILESLELEKPADLKKIFIVDVYATTQTKIDLLQKCIDSIKVLGIDIMVVSHCPLPDHIISSVDYYVYDKDNRFNDIYAVAYRTIDGIEVTDIISKSHSYPIVRAIKAGFSLAQNMGYEFFYFTEFDHEYSNKGLAQIKDLTLSLLNSRKDILFFQPENAVFGDAVGVYYETSFFLGHISKFLESFNSYFPKDL